MLLWLSKSKKATFGWINGFLSYFLFFFLFTLEGSSLFDFLKNINFKKVYLQLLSLFSLNWPDCLLFLLVATFLFLLLSPFASFIASVVMIWSVSQTVSGPPVYYGYLSFETVNFLIPFINSVRCFRAGGILLHNWPLFNNLIRALPFIFYHTDTHISYHIFSLSQLITPIDQRTPSVLRNAVCSQCKSFPVEDVTVTIELMQMM